MLFNCYNDIFLKKKVHSEDENVRIFPRDGVSWSFVDYYLGSAVNLLLNLPPFNSPF